MNLLELFNSNLYYIKLKLYYISKKITKLLYFYINLRFTYSMYT